MMKHSSETITDNALVQSALAGEPDAFSEIVRRYHQPLAEFAAARTARYQDAEDAVQETFLRAFENLHSFDRRYSLKNWLFTIAYRELVSSYRKKKPLRLSDNTAGRLSTETAASTSFDWLWETARMMGTEIFSILWLKYKQEMSIAEIAQVTKKSQTAVRVLLYRARKRLARQIAEEPTETSDSIPWNFRKAACAERTQS